jgi:Ca2+-binding EF-hand superfamily protein
MIPSATPPADAEMRAEVREAFDQFDANHDGRLQQSEFLRFIRELDPNMTETDARVGFAEIDVDHDRVIEFEEFLKWWTAP